MNVSVERLRVWLLVGAGVLALVVAGFLGYAHYRAHRFLAGLPAKLGVDIQRETNAFTYSQSVQGKTIYTIHAAKAVQRNDGKVTLHDVGIVLYGRKTDRADRIYGSEFEYDQNAGVIRAMGVVHIDLEAPAPADSRAKVAYASGQGDFGADGREPGASGHGGDDERLIHVKTSGLVFLQKLGVAATDQALEFEFKGLTGHAVGADFSSDTGQLTLHSAVSVHGIEQGQPVVLTAARAELNRQTELATLTQVRYEVVGGAEQGRLAEMDHATIHLRSDGSVERMEGDGSVVLATGDGSTVTASRGDLKLNASGLMESMVLLGGVHLAGNQPMRQTRGEAEEGRATFDKAGRLERVILNGGVHLHTRERSGSGVDAWNERDLTGKTVDLVLTALDERHVVMREATATGDAKLVVVSAPPPGGKSGSAKGGASSVLSGDVLTAAFQVVDGGSALQFVHGVGHTTVDRVSETGAEETSVGDTLEARFVSRDRQGAVATSGSHAAGSSGVEHTTEIATAVQTGHVVVTNRPVAKAGLQRVGQPRVSVQRAVAERAEYEQQNDEVTLTGAVQVSDGGNVVWADRVVLEQQSGDAVAVGSVKASYVPEQAASSSGAASAAEDPVHVLASRAEMKHNAGTATFYGAAGRLARLWQGASQVEAPVLIFEQQARHLLARGGGQGSAMAVHAVFVSAGGDKAKRASVVRVASRELSYSDVTRRADFTGGVVVNSSDGSMSGQTVTVYLRAAGGVGTVQMDPLGGKSVRQASFMGGSVERVEGHGGVELTQPGRRVTGEQVVYTALDGMFVMMGTHDAPPKMVDAVRGTITGAVLRFHAGDNSVMVLHGTGEDAEQRVRTETRVKQ